METEFPVLKKRGVTDDIAFDCLTPADEVGANLSDSLQDGDVLELPA